MGNDALLALRAPRDSAILAEASDGPDMFVLEEGPFQRYERTLEVTSAGGDMHDVTETIEWKLAIPLWWLVFWLPTFLWFRSGMKRDRPWWAPAGRLDARSGTVVGLLAIIAVVNGFLGTVIGQTLTFAADEFCGEFSFDAEGLRTCVDPAADKSVRGNIFSIVRVAILLSVGLTALADRKGRRRVLASAVGIGCLATAAGALSPSLTVLTLTQIVARGLATGIGIVMLVLATEELPAKSRAYGVSLLILAAGLGSGMVLWVLPLADIADWSWRLVYLVGGLLAAPAIWAGLKLPVGRRFAHTASTGSRSSLRELWHNQKLRKRLILLSISGLLAAVFSQPASQLHNDFLRSEQGFTGTDISIFTLITSTPIGIGVFIGGLLADRAGRRFTAALGTILGSSLFLGSLFTSGAPLWLLTFGGVVLGGIAVPAVGVYGPELFPTRLRSTANGVIRTTAVIGSVIGLQVVSRLSERWDALGPALAVTLIGPLILAVLFLVAYPETADRTLESINDEPEFI